MTTPTATTPTASRSWAEQTLAGMTIEEKVAQITGTWFSGLLTDGDLDPEKMATLLAKGAGHITRIAAESKQGPELTAGWANAVQRHLVDNTRLGIPAIIHEEAVAGLCGKDATQFPQAIGLASTWDPDLMEQVAESAGRQLRAVGARLALSPVMDIARDPRWGRVEETYGEDPELSSRMAVAYVHGMQGQGVVCAAKHFLGYGVPDAGLNHGEVSIGPRRLRDVIAAPFRACINEAGLGAVMNAYNEIDGLPCAGSPEILRDLLRGELGFTGTVVADYFAVILLKSWHHVAADAEHAARLALTAGLDIELPDDAAFKTLPDQVRRGLVDERLIDEACLRILEQKHAIGLIDDPYVDAEAAPAQFDTPADRALARRAAARSIVLLQNDGVLPLRPGTRVAVFGPSADDPRLLLGDYHFPAHLDSIAQLQGAPTAGGGEQVQLRQVPTSTPLSALRERFEVVDSVEGADVAVVCVGGRSGLSPECTSGEFRDVTDLRLAPDQLELIRATAATGTPTVVVVIGGRAHSLSELTDVADAIVMAWLPGEEGGAGLADVLSGEVDAGGRLPVSLLRSVGQVGLHSGHHRGGGKSMFLSDYVDAPHTTLFPFGHGLSYTTWEYPRVEVHTGSVTDDVVVEVEVRNTGERPGDEVVQIFARDDLATLGVPERRLMAFRRISAGAGELVRLRFTIPAGRFGFHGRDLHYRVEPGDFTFFVGGHEVVATLTGDIAHPDLNSLPPFAVERV